MPILAAVLTLVTALLLVVDLARPAATAPLRGAVATVLGPAQAALAGGDGNETTELRQERDELGAEVARLRDQIAAHEQLELLAGSRTGSAVEEEQRLLPARVVAFAPGTSPVGGRTVTVDVGAREGVSVDQTVVSADGLVGRVLRASPRTADVLLLGDPGVVVGVRFGEEGALGSVEATPQPGLPARGQGELTLTALGDSTIEVGDEVTTLGSPENRPYAAHLLLGTVTAVDPERGQLGRTAVVSPAVDTDTLDLVAVLLTEEAER